MVPAVYRDAAPVLGPWHQHAWRFDRRTCRAALPVGMDTGARGRYAAPRPDPSVQHHFTLAEYPSTVGQVTLIGTLTASNALQNGANRPDSVSMLATPAIDSGLAP